MAIMIFTDNSEKEITARHGWIIFLNIAIS